MDLLKMEEPQLVDKVVRDFEKAEKRVDQYKNIWQDNYRLYRSKIKTKRKGKANLFIPYIWPTVEQLKGRGLQALFSKRPYVSCVGVGPDDEMSAKVMEELIDWQVAEKIKLPLKFINVLQSLYLYGTAITLQDWKTTEKKVKQKEDVIDPNTLAKIDERIIEVSDTVYDDPTVDVIPLDEFYPDPEGWDMESCEYACIRVYRDEAYLRQVAKDGKYTLPDIIEDASGTFATNFRDAINNFNTVDDADRNKKHELITRYSDDAVITILNRKHVIRKEENPNFTKEKPFTKIVVFPQEKEFYGVSLVEILADLQEELNTTRNQRIDNVSLILNKMWKKRRGADIDNNDLISRAGNVIEVDNPDDITPIEFTDVTQSAYNEEQIIKQDIQYISGVSEFARGATPQRKETATTVNALTEAANMLFNYAIMVIEMSGLIPIIDAIKKLNQQYMTEDKVIRLFNTAQGAWNYKTITPNEIQGNFDIVSVSPKLEAQNTKENKRAQMLELLDKISTNPLMQQYLNVPEFMKKLLETYDIGDYEKLIQQPPPIGQIPQEQIPPEMPFDMPPEEMPPIGGVPIG